MRKLKGQLGQNHHAAKLTQREVDIIRLLHAKHRVTYGVLSEAFGVSKRTVGSICRFERWCGNSDDIFQKWGI